ncbi:MAG: hypothetical protein N3G74_00695 [Candidatus Micrarchaeota archaeon]|nr:hypothetical protein [Candidatus Micrarchaeota archaeon]
MVATLQEILDHSIATVFNTDWFGTSILALILSAALSALAWMLSSAFQSNELKGWARKELSEFIVSALILVLTVPLLMVITGITIAYATSADPNIQYGKADPFSIAKSYLDKVEQQLVSVYTEVSGSIIVLTAISSFSIDLGLIAKLLITFLASLFSGGAAAIPAFFTKFSVLIGMGSPFSTITNFLETIQSAMIVILLAFFVQKEILFFIQAAALPVLMPTGVLLRAFPLTRRAGSTLIALALTLFIVYPLTLAFVGHMYETTYNAVVSEQPALQPQGELHLLVERELPLSGDYYLDYKQEFRWLTYYNITYSIWHDINCNQAGSYFDSQIMGNNLAIPPDNHNYWRITSEETVWTTTPDGVPLPNVITSSKCYKKFIYGVSASSQTIGFVLTKDYYPEKDYKNHSIILVAKLNENAQAMQTNVEIFNFYLGNPCEKYPLLCKLGIVGGEVPINDVSYGTIAIDAAISGLKGMTKTFATVGGRTITNIGLTPYAAGYVFYDFTNSLPLMVLPFLIVLFSFVVILMVSVSSFKSISTTLGGETKLIELGRLI